MSATTIDTSRPAVPFARLVKVELRKMTDTRAGRALVLVTGGFLVLTVAVLLLIAALDDGFDATASDVAGVLQFVSLLIVPVFAILISTSEWGQRSHLTTFTLEPVRSRVLAAKLAAVLVFSVASLAVAIAVGALGNAAFGLFGVDPVWNFGLSDLAWSLAFQLVLILSAFALGLLFLNTAVAVAVFYVSAIMLRFIVYPVLFNFVDAFIDIAPYLDVAFGYVVAESGQNLNEETVGGLARVAPMIVATTIWVVVPGVAGWLRAMRSEIK